MMFSFSHVWLASGEFRREKSGTWHVASIFLKRQYIRTVIDNMILEVATSAVVVMKFVVPTMNTLLLNLTRVFLVGTTNFRTNTAQVAF